MFSSECAPQLSIAGSKVKWPLRFAFSYVQPITQCYKQRTVPEIPLQSTTENIDNSCLQMESHILCFCESTPWAVSRKKRDTNEDKAKSMMHALYVLWYAKRYVSGQSDVEQ